jgi:hypothetical protein
MRGPRSAVFQSLERRAVSVLHPSQKIGLASPKAKRWNREWSPSNQVYGDACFAADLTSIIRSMVSFFYLFSYILLFPPPPLYTPVIRLLTGDAFPFFMYSG